MNPLADDEPKRELIDGRTLDIEIEDLSDPGDVPSKYDPNLIRVDPRTFSLHHILDMIDSNELDLTPDFQRKKVWKEWQKSRLIESIMLRIPLPAFYFAADGDGLMHVVDGLQRISTIYDFVKGERDFNTLEGLQYLTKEQLGGFSWAQLGGSWRRRLQTTQIFVNVIDPQTPLPVKFQIFERLNTGGSPLTAQEIRNCISRQRSRDYLRKLARSESFGKATTYSLKDHPRMGDLEVVLRFCAFRLEREEELEPYEAFDSLDDFLTAASRRLDNEKKCPQKRLDQLVTDFECAMQNAVKLFGDRAFRKWYRGQTRKSPFNKALFESWSCILADYQWEQLAPHRDKIISAFQDALEKDVDFRESLAQHTSAPKYVRTRFLVIRGIVEKYVK